MRNKQAESAEPPAYHHGDLRRALIESALALVTEEQDWTFSLREVARRAGVSHNAPYNHFADKRDLLAAVAVLGFAALGERIQAGTSRIANARTALVKSAVVYVTFGVENPAHYRLMFGSVLVTTQEGRPKAVADAGLGRERSWRRLSGVELWQASLTLLFGETRILALRFYLLGRPFTA